MKRTALLFATIAILAAAPTNSCSFGYDPVFFFDRRPPAPMPAYVTGKLGVILPTFAQSHLVVAWRYLSGKPLSEAERKEMNAYYAHRLDHDEPQESEPDPVDVWMALRNPVIPSEERPEYARNGFYYSEYENCTDDAFRTATKTLQSHIDELGAHHPAVVAWVAAQNAVFSNCGRHGGMPAPADPSLPAAFRLDRAYQIAAATFYAGDYDRAHDAFVTISRDPQSPWRRIARIVAARALIRKGVLASGDHLDEAALQTADKELRRILTDNDMRSLHHAADELDDYVELHIAPQQENAKLAAEIAGGHLTKHNVTDYVSSLDNDSVKPSDAMSEWIRTFRAAYQVRHPTRTPKSRNDAAYGNAHERWQSTHALPWLVAAITFASKDAEGVGEVLAAASRVDPHSPAYATLAYHRARLLIDRGENGEARRLLDAVLAPGEAETLPSATQNLFRTLRLPFAPSLDAFVRDASRTVVGESLQTAEPPAEPLFDYDAEAVVNTEMPLSALIEAAHAPNLPPGIRAQLTAAAFTRAIVLGRPEIAQKLIPEMHRDFDEPDEAENYRGDENPKDVLDRFAAAPPSRRRVAAIDLLIHMPGLSPFIMSYDNRIIEIKRKTEAMTENVHSQSHENWWCVGGLRHYEAIYPRWGSDRPASTPSPAFLAPLRAESDAEQKDLQISGSSFVLRGVLVWAKEYPDDPQIPESLALAIQETQWSCPDASTRKFAEAAFNLLHSRYGKTKAAKSTKYWYDGRS